MAALRDIVRTASMFKERRGCRDWLDECWQYSTKNAVDSLKTRLANQNTSRAYCKSVRRSFAAVDALGTDWHSDLTTQRSKLLLPQLDFQCCTRLTRLVVALCARATSRKETLKLVNFHVFHDGTVSGE